MRVLLDTHTFLWWVEDAPDLSDRARQLIAAAENECLLSHVSCWEIAIKSSLGKLKLATPVERFIPEQLSVNGFSQLEIGLRHITRVGTMPFHHRDPFDRLLAAQALEEGSAIISVDAVFEMYGVKRVW